METPESSIENLPIDIIEMIAMYLTVKDVAACCATSRGMRELFDNDILWKPHCDKELAEYLRVTPCKVQPGFVSPDTDNMNLSPISEYRLSFMLENHLWNNWRTGKFTKQDVHVAYGNFYDVFCSNDHVMSFNESSIRIFDVRTNPAQVAAEGAPITQSVRPDRVYLENNVIIAVQLCKVEVYNVDLAMKECSFTYGFMVDESNVRFYSLDGLENILKQRKKALKKLSCSVLLQQYFAGCISGDSSLHIWDISTGIKLKEEICPVKNNQFAQIKGSETLNLVIEVQETFGIANYPFCKRKSCTVLVYSLKDLKFLSFRAKLPGNNLLKLCVCSKIQYIGIVYHCGFRVYNVQTSEVIFRSDNIKISPHIFRSDYINGPLQVYKDNFLYLENNVLNVYNPISQSGQSLMHGIREFWVCGNIFIQVLPLNYCKYSLWEVDLEHKKLKKTSNIQYIDFLLLNKASTRCFVNNDFSSMFNFW